MNSVDLNCDLGESFGVYQLGADHAVLPHLTSANIACGFHAGDPTVMRRTVAAALAHGVAIGAHPGFPDLAGFGRRALEVTPQEAYDLVLYQIGALAAFVGAAGGTMQHVKPHGALYNLAAARPELADAVAEAVRAADPGLVLFGLAGSHLIDAGRRAGLRAASEAFVDRNYTAAGALVPRSRADALVTDPELAARRAVGMVRHGRVRSADGPEIRLRADTLCIHGDAPRAAMVAARLRQAFAAEGITVRAFGQAGDAITSNPTGVQ